MNEKVVDLRAIDRKRVNAVYERMQAIPSGNNIWYIHTVLAQCFLPYKDPKKAHWQKQNGDYSIILTSGAIRNPKNPKELLGDWQRTV